MRGGGGGVFKTEFSIIIPVQCTIGVLFELYTFRKLRFCLFVLNLVCYSHDNNHWKSAPLWSEGPFCACTNSNNNTYWCARNINSTHNYLYCEYVTGMMTYFDLRVDPFQLRNLLYTLTGNR